MRFRTQASWFTVRFGATMKRGHICTVSADFGEELQTVKEVWIGVSK